MKTSLDPVPRLVSIADVARQTQLSYERVRSLIARDGGQPVGVYQGTKLYLADTLLCLSRAYRFGKSRRWRVLKKDCLTLRQTAEKLKIHSDSLRDNYRTWQVPYYKQLTGMLYFEWKEVEEWSKKPRARRSLSRARLRLLEEAMKERKPTNANPPE